MRYGTILLLLALLVAAPSADSAERCTKPGARTLLENSDARVFVAWMLAIGDGQYHEVDGVAPSATEPTPLGYARGIDPSVLTLGDGSVS